MIELNIKRSELTSKNIMRTKTHSIMRTKTHSIIHGGLSLKAHETDIYSARSDCPKKERLGPIQVFLYSIYSTEHHVKKFTP